MKKILPFVLMLLLFGCAYMGIQPSVCDRPGAETSLICARCTEMGVQVEDIDLVLQIAALRALDDEGKEVVLGFFDDVEAYLNYDASYKDLIKFVREKVKLTGPEILIISRYLPRFESVRLISEFDRNLILSHIENQRAVLK